MVQFRQPLQTSQNLTDRSLQVSKRRKSENLKLDSGLAITKATGEDIPAGISISKLSPPFEKKHKLAHKPSNKEESIHPFVSITPISSGSNPQEQSRLNNENSGIEIIPLGGIGGSSDMKSPHLKSKVRDFKRSFSMDDKRRVERTEKRRREEGKHRSSVSPNKVDKDEAHKSKKGTENVVRDPKAKLAGVIERLASQTGDAVAGLEIRPANVINAAAVDPSDKSAIKMTFRNKVGGGTSAQGGGDKDEGGKGSAPSAISTSTSLAHKTSERFVSDAYPSESSRWDESEDSKKAKKSSSKDKQTVSLHIMKSPSSVHGSSSLRPPSEISDGMLEDPFLLGK